MASTYSWKSEVYLERGHGFDYTPMPYEWTRLLLRLFTSGLMTSLITIVAYYSRRPSYPLTIAADSLDSLDFSVDRLR